MRCFIGIPVIITRTLIKKFLKQLSKCDYEKLIIDIDMTLTKGKGPIGYEDAIVNEELVAKLRGYKNRDLLLY